MKKLIIIAFVIASQGLVSCTWGEAAAGAIGVGVGIGVGSHWGHHHHRHYRHGWGWWSTDLQAQSATSEAKTFAARHGISVDAALKIQKAFNDLDSKGMSSFAAIGLNKADLKAIVKNDLPESASIQRMADKLDMSQAQARDLLVSVNRDFEAQASNVKSDYWQSCMKGGEWSTPQNSFCTQTNANGCSPATGASMCY